jgi:hypothetical protein
VLTGVTSNRIRTEATVKTCRWKALVAAVLALAIVAVPAMAMEAVDAAELEESALQPQLLAGENRIDVDGNARSEVVLAGQQEMMPFASTIEIETESRIGGLVLVERGRAGRAVLIYVEADQDELCGGPCPKNPGAGKQGFVMNGVGEAALPAGTYDLYVVSPDGPASVTLRIPSAQGTAVLDTVAHDGVSFAAPENRSPFPTLDYHAGADGTLDSQGLLLNMFVVTGDIDSASIYGDCIYTGGEPEVAAYAAGCPTAQDGTLFRGLYVTNEGWTSMLTVAVAHVDPGVYGLGSYRTGISRLDKVTTYLLWLPY